MLPKGRVAHRVSPVDQPFLQSLVETFEAGRGLGQRHGAVMRTIERIGELIVGNVGANAPIGSLAAPDL